MPAPQQISAGRVVLALHGPDEAPAIADLINANLDHLRPWMPWAHRPTDAHEQAMRLAVTVEQATRDHDMGYSITVDGVIVGGCGLHRRIAPDVLDIGYWIAAEHEGHGYVTETVAALTRVAFDRYAARRVRITCNETNLRSASVPRRLGFIHEDTVDDDDRRTMVWVMDAARWPESPGSAIAVSYA